MSIIFQSHSHQQLDTNQKNPEKQQQNNASVEKIEEDFTMARLYISKMKSEAKSLMTHCNTLEGQQNDNVKKLQSMEEQLSSSKLLLQQHEAKMAMVSGSLKEVETKKSSLQVQVDKLTEECAQLKAQGICLNKFSFKKTRIILSKVFMLNVISQQSNCF